MTQQALNVLGTALVPCSFEPLTGFYRDGCCNTDLEDHGTHVVCAGSATSFCSSPRCAATTCPRRAPSTAFPA